MTPACPTCSAGDAERLGKLPNVNVFAGVHLDQALDGGWLYRCRRCRLKYRHPVQSAEEYAALYDNDTTTSWPGNEARPDWDLVLHYLAQHRDGGSVLDFGCYTGGLLARLGAAYERHGVEINAAAAAVAAQAAECRVWPSLADIPREQRFDVIISCDVIEHVPDPSKLIGELLGRLVADGILVLTTGDGDNRLWNRYGANWWYCMYPEHIAFVSRAWLDYVAPRSGFRVAHVENFHYGEIGALQRPVHNALTWFYGCFPNAFLALRRLLDRAQGKPGITSVTGVGVSADHLLIVLRRAAPATDARP